MQHASSWKEVGPDEWAQVEFGSAALEDKRLVKRLMLLASDKARLPGGSIPQASGSWARTKGAYRLFSHPKMKAETVLSGHARETQGRMRGCAVILAVQDTTSLNYATHPHTEGLGPIGNRADKTLGIWLHTTLAVTPQGQALGIVHHKMWTRDPAQHGQNRQRNSKALAEKESHRWLEGWAAACAMQREHRQSQVVVVTDREGDLYEMLAGAMEPGAAAVLVRAQHNRCVEGSSLRLWEVLASQRGAGRHRVWLPRRAGQAACWAEFEIRFKEVRLQAPTLKEDKPPLHLWALEARQLGVPADKAICWRLLSSLPIRNQEEAMEKLQWYTQRWQIEVFFRTLKSGCRAEQHQLRSVEKLRSVLAMEMVVAWRVMEMIRASRQEPDAPAHTHFTTQELELLRLLRFAGRTTPLTLREAVREVAKMGGFLARKSDGEPGAKTLWLGLQRLRDLAAGFALGKLMGNA